MYTEQTLLFTLSVGEFMALVKSLVDKAIEEKEQGRPKQETDKEQDVLTISDLTEFLHCSKASVHNYKHLGLPFYRVGRKILFKKDEVLEFMKTLKNKKHNY